jgi:S1-C subfamily serine protease
MTDAALPLQSSQQLSEDLAAIVAATSSSVVGVDGRGRRASSGLIWEPGLAIAAEETIERDDALALTLPDGRRVEATLAGRDPTTDIAVLRYAGNEAGLAAQSATKDLRPGHLALAVGRYRGDVVASLGMVARVGPAWRSSQGGLIDARVSIDARLAASAEGGALVSADGSLIGMAVFGPRRRVLAIPASTIGRVVALIKEKGHVARGYLGLGLQRVPLAVRDGTQGGAEQRRAAMVVTVDPAGPAKAAGIHQGDIIVAVGGAAVTGVRSLYQQLGPDSVGRTTSVDLVRAGAPMKLDVVIAPRARA